MTDAPATEAAADAAPLDVTSDTLPADAAGDAVVAVDAPQDVQPFDAGPYACGSQTCGANQVCVHPCSGIDAGHPIEPVCVDVPAGCGAATCDCVHPSQCPPSSSPSFPGCVQSSPRDLTCQGCV